jgi:hypothetical protein
MEQLHSQMSVSHQATTFISHELALLRSDLADRLDSCPNKTPAILVDRANDQGMSAKSRILKKQSTISQGYSGLLGKLLIRTVSESTSFINSDVESTETRSTRTCSWAFMPSFFSRYIEYQSFNTCGFVQRALRIYPLIPNNHPIWHMCRMGDLKGIQGLLCTRKVSPFSVDIRGTSLLHVSHSDTNPTK